MTRSIPGLFRSTRGAVAPTVALSLFGLIAAGGIAFDYARLATLDTELQSAADQAALAAAGQLDGQDGACARAAAAASALLVNNSYLANEPTATSQQVTVSSGGVADCSGNANIQFYAGYDDATESFVGAPLEAGDDALARVVWLRVDPRQVYYALTPIVAAMQSGEIRAEAVAGLSSSICKVPPVMICNPAEASNPNFNISSYVGNGIWLTAVDPGGNLAPGNYGYLNSGGAADLKEALAWNSPPGDCLGSSGVTTKPGGNISVGDAMNTRFDVYNAQCPDGGSCSASLNSVKDVIRPLNAGSNQGCTAAPVTSNQTNKWHLPANYYGSGNFPAPGSTTPLVGTPSVMGHPRDMCHAAVANVNNAICGRLGNGAWDADTYFRTNYVRTSIGTSGEAIGTHWSSAKWQLNTGLSTAVPRTVPGPNPGDPPVLNPSYASRYNVYLWEISKADQFVDGLTVLGPRTVSGSGPTAQTAHGKPVCSPAKGYGSGVVPGGNPPDRRRISAALVNCNALAGKETDIPVEKWIALFLVEPSISRERTGDGDIYVEMIGETTPGTDDVIRRDVPYLIR